jgi:hypothetical protein
MFMGIFVHHQQCNYKNKRKRRTNRCIFSNNNNGITMNNFDSNPDQNTDNKKYKNKKYYCEKCCTETMLPPFDIGCHNPDERYNCKPRRGELVINGGFENQQDPFLGWVINSGVENIDPNDGDIAHQGLNAASIGYPKPYGLLYQDVPGICPGLFYQLNFFMSASTKCSNSCVNVRMDFLDHCKKLLGSPALDFLIPKDSLSNEVFTGFNNSTHVAAPAQTRYARISFEINTAEHHGGYVHLDDVSLITI